MIFRKLKGLEDLISVSVVHPLMPAESWVFGEYPGATEDHVNHAHYLYENYLKAAPGFDGLVTVPVLWDKKQQTIVNNESSEIIRMLNSAFNALLDKDLADIDFYPEALRAEIDEINEQVYTNVNNGVYRAGFARTQQAYNRAYDRLFNTLDALEARLSKQRYLVGERLTEADWRLFTTLVRFDAVYYNPLTTLGGVVEKTTGEEPFNAPPEIGELWKAKDFGKFVHPKLKDVPVCMLYDADTTGGNSGSPVLNARGELVGINFDRAWEATINDFAWNESYSRSIAVDACFNTICTQSF